MTSFEESITKVKNRIRELPESKQEELLALVHETETRHNQVKESAEGARIALADLRLLMKYIQFDLEATERENAET